MGLAAAGLMVALAIPAIGADRAAKPERAGAFKAIVDCRSIPDGDQRLACYDLAAAALDTAEAKGDVVVIDRAQVQEARKAAFGFNFQMPTFLTQGEKPEALNKIEATVASARQDAHGKWTIRLEDGAVWTQIDAEKLRKAPPAGTRVEVRTASLGSFFMKIEGLGTIRAKRQN
jgi:hypothetical protein